LTRPPAEKYLLAQPLGAGGEKEIVQVRDRDTCRDVALARPRAGRSLQSFIREARILAQLEHPHIVPVHDLGLAPDGRPYFTMKLLSGETLEAVLGRLRAGDAKTRASYPLPVLLDIFVRVCDAVSFAHAQGVLHRDIKPANVQIGKFGEVRLMDWGLAKRLGDPPDAPGRPCEMAAAPAETMAGTVKGTPGYMAPEQAQGTAVDVRTDTYALGALLYAMLTWQPPVTGSHIAEVLARTVAGVMVPPRQRVPDRTIPPPLAAIAVKALARAPAKRYQTAEALLVDVQAYTNGYATSAETAGPLRLLWLVVKRHRAVSWVTAASLMALVVVGGVAVARIRASRDETRTALVNLRQEQAVRAQLTRAAVPRLLADARAQLRALAYDEALATLRTVVGVDPGQVEAWDLTGWIYLGQEQFSQAEAAFCHEWHSWEDIQGDERRRPSPAPETTGARGRRETARRAATRLRQHAAGLALAEHGRQLVATQASAAGLPPEAFRSLLEEARAAGSRTAQESRTALGIFCQRRNPGAATNAAQRAFVVWAVRALHDGRAGLALEATAAGLVARLTGAAANDLLPLAGLPLVGLDLHDTAVRDLQPLRGMPLQTLDLSGAPVVAFEALYGMPLRELRAYGLRKLPADLLARCPAMEVVQISPGTELSRKDATWPAGVRVVRGAAAGP
jgi:serine/threonine-protein kinase